MRRLVWALPVMFLLLLSPSVAADEVSDLKDLIDRLERTVAQLEERAQALERRIEALGGGSSGGTDERDGLLTPTRTQVSGRYELDLEALVADDVAEMAREQGLSAAEEAELRRLVVLELEGYRFDITLKRDGTFTLYLAVPDEDDLRRRGNWTLNGKRVALEATHQDGQRLTEPDTTYATYNDGRLDVEGEDGASFVLRRR